MFAGLIEVEVSGELVYRDSDIGSLVDGDLIVTSEITFDRVRVRSGPRVTINRAGTGAVSTYLGNNEDGIFHFQDTDGIDTEAVSAIAAADRLVGGANLRDANLVSRVDGLVTGDRLIVAFTLPSPTPVDHAVDAGDSAFSFALPRPTVTHTPFVPSAKAVNAGDAAFAFDLPQPTVTHVGIFSTATRLTLSTPIPAARGVRVGDLLAFGELGSETIDGLITSVQPRREMSARVTLLPMVLTRRLRFGNRPDPSLHHRPDGTPRLPLHAGHQQLPFRRIGFAPGRAWPGPRRCGRCGANRRFPGHSSKPRYGPRPPKRGRRR